MRHKILIFLAVLFGLLAFILTYKQLEAEKARINGDSEHVVLIRMKVDKNEGQEITEADIIPYKTMRNKEAQMLSREIPWNERAMVVGRKLITAVNKDQTLQTTDLQQPTLRNSFNTMIKRGMRAVSVPVDPVSSINYLIQPNDKVDVIGTFRFPSVKGNAELDTITLTILQDVKVLAVGNRWGDHSVDPRANRNYGTVTLEVHPEEVEMLIFASQKGNLSFSLRKYDDTVIERNVESRRVNFSLLEKEIPNYNKRREQLRGTR